MMESGKKDKNIYASLSRQLILDFPSSPEYSFDNFYLCPGNEQACQFALSFCEDKNFRYNPLFFFGNQGLGKTHLLKAIGNFFKKKSSGLKIVYISVLDILKIPNKSSTDIEFIEFSEKYKQLDLLLMDDIHLVEKNTLIEDQIFNIYNGLMERGNKIVLAGRKSPQEMLSMQKHLQSRLLSGLVVKMSLITDEIKKKILFKMAKEAGVTLPDNVLNFLLTHYSRDVLDFKKMFLAINKYSMSTKKKITIPLIKQMIF